MLAAVEGLSEADLTRAAARSARSIAQPLNHLAYDDEISWGARSPGGDEECVGLIQDGWKPVTSVADAAASSRRWGRHTGRILAEVDLDASPRSWPRRRCSRSRPSRTRAAACCGG